MIRIQRAVRRTKSYNSCNVLRTLSTKPAVEPVVYPKVEDLSPRCVHRRQQEEYFEEIKKLDTVEEKLIALNIPKYYGWPSYVLKENVLPYNFLPFSQFITRTVISEDNRLPSELSEADLHKLKERVKDELEKVIIFQENSARYKHEIQTIYAEEEKLPYYDDVKICDIKTRHLVKQMNSAIVRVLASEHHHLFSAQMDLDPRVEAFWRVGGFYSTEKDRKLRKEKEIDESMIEDRIDRFFQYFGSPILQLRTKEPLQYLPKIDIKNFIPDFKMRNPDITQNLLTSGDTEKSPTQNEIAQHDGNEIQEHVNDRTTGEISNFKHLKFYPLQEYRYSPDLYLDMPRERLHGAVIPGFWPNDPYRFGIVSYHSTSHCLNRPVHYGAEDAIEVLHSQAIIASYALAYGQACYQGFSTYNDITYPFVTQAVLTNGKLFSFYQYQLNTITLHTDKNEADNPLYNECYATPPTELFHEVGVDKIKGWNDEAILNLLTIYTKTPNTPTDVDLCPYLNKSNKLISQIPEDERRKWLHDVYRHLSSHRPRHFLPPEIYDWERIYKVDIQHRFKDARKRFYERFQDPINDKKLNDHVPKYIPKALRPHKKADNRAKTYYPDVFPKYHEIV